MHSQSCVNLGLSLFFKGLVMDSSREKCKYVVGEVDVTTIPTKHLYIAPGLGGTNPKHKKHGFLIKILQLLVPLLIIGLALAVRAYTKKE
ncbi:hypothetical protein NC652_002443 [Populus alba x Populus x berolinensis]|nr:hypothetical protein NC652_002443 [Populus alba x Populus x berolinensis]